MNCQLRNTFVITNGYSFGKLSKKKCNFERRTWHSFLLLTSSAEKDAREKWKLWIRGRKNPSTKKGAPCNIKAQEIRNQNENGYLYFNTVIRTADIPVAMKKARRRDGVILLTAPVAFCKIRIRKYFTTRWWRIITGYVEIFSYIYGCVELFFTRLTVSEIRYFAFIVYPHRLVKPIRSTRIFTRVERPGCRKGELFLYKQTAPDAIGGLR